MITKNVNGKQVEMSAQEESDFIAEADSNLLPRAIARKVASIKREALLMMQQQVAIKDFDQIEVLREFWLSIDSQAHQPTAKWQYLIDVWQSGKDAVIAVKALPDSDSVESFQPSWPI